MTDYLKLAREAGQRADRHDTPRLCSAIEELVAKGENLCHGLGNSMMEVHDLKRTIEAQDAKLTSDAALLAAQSAQLRVQAAEIERLKAGVLTADRLKYEAEKQRAERAETLLINFGHKIPPGPIGRGARMTTDQTPAQQKMTAIKQALDYNDSWASDRDWLYHRARKLERIAEAVAPIAREWWRLHCAGQMELDPTSFEVVKACVEAGYE